MSPLLADGLGGEQIGIAIGTAIVFVLGWVQTNRKNRDAKREAAEAKQATEDLKPKVDSNSAAMAAMSHEVVRIDRTTTETLLEVTKALNDCREREAGLTLRVTEQGQTIDKLRFDNRKIMRVLAAQHPDVFQKPEPPGLDEDGGSEEDL